MNSFPPILSTTRGQVEIGERLLLSSLVDYFDLDGNPAQSYQIRDNGTSAASGFLLVNGVRQASGLWITVSAAVFESSVQYQAALIEDSESFSIRANDGIFWSEVVANRIDTIPTNFDPPVATGVPSSVLAREVIQATGMVTYSDPDGNPAVSYRFVDRRSNQRGGRFILNGVTQAQGQWFEVAASDLSGLVYSAAQWGVQGENVSVQANDGKFWGPVSHFAVTTTENKFAPDVTAITKTIGTDRVIGLNSMMRASDRDGNTIKQVAIYETGPVPSGSFRFDGVTLAPLQWHTFDFEDVGRITYQGASGNSQENFRVRVNDGSYWSTTSATTVTTIIKPDIDVTTTEISVDTLEEVNVLDLVTGGGIGVAFDRYVIIDENDGTTSGRVTFQGSAQAQREELSFTRGQMNNVEFRGSLSDLGRQTDSYLVRAFSGDLVSEWKRIRITTDPVGNRALISGLDHRLNWGGSDGITRIPYAFLEGQTPPLYTPTDLDPDPWGGTSEFDPVMKETARLALSTFEQIANLEFVEVPYNEFGTGYSILFGAHDIDDAGGTLAYAFLPANNGLGNVVSDVYIDNGDYPIGLTQGGEGSGLLATLVHELGHVLGFKHPFLDGDPPGQPPFLPEATNRTQFTIMSYNRDFGFFPEEPSTPMLYDIVEAQRIYGANETTNLGDTQHFFDEAHLQYIYDAGGRDTINYTNSFRSNVVDLHQGTYSSIQGVANGLLIPYGVVIENARGGRADDLLIGNEVQNFLFGNNGADRLRGYGGNDILRGGLGSDTYEWHFGDGRDTIREEQSGGIDVLEMHDITGRMDSLPEDFVVFKLGNSLRIDLKLDNGPHDGTIVMTDQHQESSRVETFRMFDPDGLQLGQDIDLRSLFIGASSSPTRFRVTGSQTEFGFVAVPV